MFEHGGRLLTRCSVSYAASSMNNYTYILLSGRALDYKHTINDFVAKNRELRQYELTSEDWFSIQLVCGWLKAYRSATLQMSTTKHSMLSSTQAIFRGLQESLKDSLIGLPSSAPLRLKDSLINAHQKLSDYFTKFDESPYYVWSSRT